MANARVAETEKKASAALDDALRRLAALEALVRAQHARIAALEAVPLPAVHIDAAASEGPEPSKGQAAATLRRIAPGDFTGWGFHEIEGDAGVPWRWFGQDTALDLPDVRAGDRILLVLVAIAQGIGTEQLFATLDGEAVGATLEGPEDDRILAITVPAGFQRQGETSLLRLSFDTAYAPPGDQRLLTLACRGIVVAGDSAPQPGG